MEMHIDLSNVRLLFWHGFIGGRVESILGFFIAIAIASPVVMLMSMIIFPVWWIEYMDRECLNRLNRANKKLLDKLNSAKNTEQANQPD